MLVHAPRARLGAVLAQQLPCSRRLGCVLKAPRARLMPHASSIYQGIDLWNYNEDDEDNDESMSAGVPVINPITGDYLRELYTSQLMPDAFIGPVSVKRIKGKGLGLVAATHVAVGQTLLMIQPLSVIHGHPASPPQLSDLVLHLRASNFLPHQLQTFHQLFRGEPRGQSSEAVPDLASMNASAPSHSLSSSLQSLAPLPYPSDHLVNIVRYNAFGDSSTDLITSRLRGDPLASLLGIWPEAALLNHSCAPNAVHFNIGDCMVVRASREIPMGEEVVLNYLGRGAMAPLGYRQEELEATYGFKCRCTRCRFESQQPDLSNGVLEAILSVLEEIKPAVIAALQRRHSEHLTSLLQLLSSLDDKLQEAFEESGISQEPALWLKAGAYDLYQLLALVREAVQPLAYRSLCNMSDCVEIAGLTAPGSDLHVLTACKFVKKVEEVYRLKNDPRVTSAQTIGLSAVKARYGPMDADALKLMMDTGAQVAADLDDIMLAQQV